MKLVLVQGCARCSSPRESNCPGRRRNSPHSPRCVAAAAFPRPRRLVPFPAPPRGGQDPALTKKSQSKCRWNLRHRQSHIQTRPGSDRRTGREARRPAGPTRAQANTSRCAPGATGTNRAEDGVTSGKLGPGLSQVRLIRLSKIPTKSKERRQCFLRNVETKKNVWSGRMDERTGPRKNSALGLGAGVPGGLFTWSDTC